MSAWKRLLMQGDFHKHCLASWMLENGNANYFPFFQYFDMTEFTSWRDDHLHVPV